MPPVLKDFVTIGQNFTKQLSGNYPYEEFTIVILTYKREKILYRTLKNLKGLPYLNKIVVIVNSDPQPYMEMERLNMNVPVVFLDKSDQNSLNNRFVPYSEISTESVFMIDDDVNLSHDEISFAFRVWRENRDQLVGFEARSHFKKAKWAQKIKIMFRNFQ